MKSRTNQENNRDIDRLYSRLQLRCKTDNKIAQCDVHTKAGKNKHKLNQLDGSGLKYESTILIF